jgi:uncharacterized repeat protein (TIGR01451 family)
VLDNLRGLSSIACTDLTLEPGQSTHCTASYMLTQSDINAGRVLNSATAYGRAPNRALVVSNRAHHEVRIAQHPALTLTKTATLTTTAGTLENDGDVTVPVVDDEVFYTYDVHNTGNVTITNIGINDPLPGLTPSSPRCDVTALAPGQSTTCRATYTLTQADFDRGGVFNVARASGQGANGESVTSPEGHARVVLHRTPLLTLTKTGEVNKTDGGGSIVAGDTVTYTYELLNNGNVTLTPHWSTMTGSAPSTAGARLWRPATPLPARPRTRSPRPISTPAR